MTIINSSNTELVSIVIPAYNAEKFVKESILSCINQTYKNIEIIVVNDGSVDDTKNIVLECINVHSNIKLIDTLHVGKVNALNIGVEKANGEYIAIHAADDVCFPYRIEEEINLIRQESDLSLVYGDMEVVDENLNIIADSFWKKAHIKTCKENCFEELLWNNFVSGGTILFKSEIIEKVFPIPNNLKYEDWWIAIVASYYGKITYTERKLIKYRQHNNNENAKLNVYDCKVLVDNQKRLMKRNFLYYEEIEKFIIKNVNDVSKKTKYLMIISYSELINKSVVTAKFKNRLFFAKNEINLSIFKFNFRKMSKLLAYIFLGDKLLTLKYSKVSLARMMEL